MLKERDHVRRQRINQILIKLYLQLAVALSSLEICQFFDITQIRLQVGLRTKWEGELMMSNEYNAYCKTFTRKLTKLDRNWDGTLDFFKPVAQHLDFDKASNKPIRSIAF